MRRSPEYPCPTCGGFARTVIAPDKAAGRKATQYACARCGTVVPDLPWARQRQLVYHPTPLQVGMKAQIGGKDFWAAGFVRYTEKDDDSTSTWWEWTLIHPDGDTRFLEFDEGKWTLIEEIAAPPDFPASLLGTLRTASQAAINGQPYRVGEAGNSTVDAVDGQIPWRITVGERRRYVEFAGNPPLSAEIALSGGNPVGEAEWFRQRAVDERQVLTWFNLHEQLRSLDQHGAVMRQRAGFGGLCLALAVASFLLWAAAARPGKVVAEGSTTAAQVPDTGLRYGPYQLSRAHRPYRLSVSTALSSSSVAVQAIVENEDASLGFDVEGELWDETGYDDEGYWHESSLMSRRDFRVDSPQQIYVRLFADPDAAATNAPISFSVEEVSLTSVPLIVFGFSSLIVGSALLALSGAKKNWSRG